MHLDLHKLPGIPTKEDFTGYQLMRAHRQGGEWRTDNNGIYDSILYPLAKAYFHEIGQLRDEMRAERETGIDWHYPYFYLYYPIIVTSGQIFTVDVTDGEPRISESKWARLKRSFKSKDLDGTLRADLVAFDYLGGIC